MAKRWWQFWKRFDEDQKSEIRDLVSEEREKAEAEAAQAKAHEVLAETEKQGEEVARVADSLRKIRDRNHFAEMLEASMRKGHA